MVDTARDDLQLLREREMWRHRAQQAEADLIRCQSAQTPAKLTPEQAHLLQMAPTLAACCRRLLALLMLDANGYRDPDTQVQVRTAVALLSELGVLHG